MGKIFLRGLLAITPVAVTVALLIWIFWILENAFSVPIRALIGPYYFPGLGIIVALIFIFIVGIIINNWLIQKIYQFNDKVIRKIPLIKTIYNSISDVVNFFNSDSKQTLNRVVMLDLNGWRILGFVTREGFEDLPEGIGDDHEVAVYIPFSYQIGGFTFMVPKANLKEVNISVEEAMRFAITAGILKRHKTSQPDKT